MELTTAEKRAFDTAEKRVFDTEQIKGVIDKVSKEGLIRHVNGNTLDNRRQNLQKVSVIEAFLNKTWTVDACCILNDDEFVIWTAARNAY